MSQRGETRVTENENESLSPKKITARNHRKGVQLKVGVEVEVKEKKKERKTVGDRELPRPDVTWNSQQK